MAWQVDQERTAGAQPIQQSSFPQMNCGNGLAQFNYMNQSTRLPMTEAPPEQAVPAPMLAGAVSGYYGSENQPFFSCSPNMQPDALQQQQQQQQNGCQYGPAYSFESSSRPCDLLVPPGVPLPGQGGGFPERSSLRTVVGPKARVFTRRKAGQVSTGRQPGKDPLVVQYEDLVPYFGISQRQACTELGVGRSTMKRLCRRFGIKRWPCATLYSNEDARQTGAKTEEWEDGEANVMPPVQVQQQDVVDQHGGSRQFAAANFSVQGPQRMDFGVAMQQGCAMPQGGDDAHRFTISPFMQHQQQPAVTVSFTGLEIPKHRQYAHQAAANQGIEAGASFVHGSAANDLSPPSAETQLFPYGMGVQDEAAGGSHGVQSMEGMSSPHHDGGVVSHWQHSSGTFRAGLALAQDGFQVRSHPKPQGDWLCTIDESWLQSKTNDDTTTKETFSPLQAAFPGEQRNSLGAMLGGMRRDSLTPGMRHESESVTLNRDSRSRSSSLWELGPRRDSLVDPSARRNSLSGRRNSLVSAARTRRNSFLALNQPGYLPVYTPGPTTPI